jgi:cytidylate kinase
VPSPNTSHDDLLRHVMRTTGLPAGSAARVIADVKAYFDESVEEYVRRRHRELQAGGLTNDPIFERIGAELRDRPVAAPELTARQLRRMVYG